MSWKPEVHVQGSWNRNGLVFESKDEAESNARNLMSRWMLVDDTRAVEVDEKPNYRWIDGRLVAIKEESNA